MAAKLAKKISTGDISDILKTPSPAYIHVEHTYCEGASSDLINAVRFLTKAANIEDPIERLKLVITGYLSGNHVSPTIC